ncbi:TonB-dependent receptor plug domain-containing protein [Roseateles sp. SL47]|uniref:TonB-dependent receptor n=1 Tax=Roseateles sp. SL47 TaxID=2995138 RepID=UPI00226E9973|nr:TonB-dependent receptor plug domain-containing protein [Roseateles sp. SL47]WAC71558.1 TonB-dependent receptor plug domain-containing protein [Roseateles sp. SL47]
MSPLAYVPFRPLPLVALLLAAQALPALAQEVPPPARPASDAAQDTSTAPAASSQSLGQVMVMGESIGLRQARANVKITAADLDHYPTGVSADKLLERVSGIQVGSSNAFGGDGFESTISMRGFGKDSIGFSIDGIPNGRTTLGGGSVPTRFFDSSNLAGIDVSQSAGIVGAPSHQALAGHINYLTQDPNRNFGLRAEAAAGSADLGRLYARVDSGEIAPGLTAYLSISRQQWKVSYVDDPAGHNTRDHADLKLAWRLGADTTLKLHSSYNDREERSGTNIVTLKQFQTNPKADGYTDTWTGVPGRDRNYRGLKGNPREDRLSYVDLSTSLAGLKVSAKAYHHGQDGTGKETGLGNAGYPGLDGRATSLYFRANDYGLSRNGALVEVSARHNDLIDWRVGAWYESYDRSQLRRWYPVLDEATGPAYSDTPDATSEDKHWKNRSTMVYAANRSSLLEGRLKLDYGLTYLDNRVDYRAPIQDSRTAKVNYVNEARVNSGVLPKLGALVPLAANTELFAGYAKNAATMTDATLEGGAAATLAGATRPHDMDTAKAFDLGLRHKGENYALGIQGFSIRSKETVAADIAGTLQSENVDQGRRINGVELSGNGRLGAAWRFYGSFTYQKARYELSDVDAQGYPAKGFIRDGADLVGIAPRNLFLEATWRPTDALRLVANVRHLSSQAGYYANPRVANSGVDERLPAYTLLGAGASYQWERVSVGLNLENITGKDYISGVAPELMTTASSVGRYFIGAPRTAVLWVRMEL